MAWSMAMHMNVFEWNVYGFDLEITFRLHNSIKEFPRKIREDLILKRSNVFQETKAFSNA